MNSRKPLILVVAALLAALAVFVLYQYVNGLKDKAFGDAEKVKVWVVHSQVAKGTYGQQTRGIIVEDEIPKKWYPPNAITSFDMITNKVAVADLSVNQIVVQGNFVDPTVAQPSLSAQLKQIRGTDQVAISIQVDQVRGVAGLIVPGDYINIMATKVNAATGGGDGGGAATGVCGNLTLPANVNPDSVLFCNQARYVYEKAEVLAVGQNAIPQPGQTVTVDSNGNAPATTQNTGQTGLITLIVPARPAQYIASLPAQNIYLELVAKDYNPVPMKPIKAEDPLPAEDPTKLTPYGPKGPA